MQLSTIFAVIIPAMTAFAAPASTSIEERSTCQYAYPDTDGYTWVSRYYDPDYELNEPAVFHLPNNAVGPCNLRLHFDSTYPPALSGNTQVEFKYQGGTGTTYSFVPGPLDRYLGSFGCQETMEFLLTISKEQGKAGYVGFPQNPSSGLYMTYGC